MKKKFIIIGKLLEVTFSVGAKDMPFDFSVRGMDSVLNGWMDWGKTISENKRIRITVEEVDDS